MTSRFLLSVSFPEFRSFSFSYETFGLRPRDTEFPCSSLDTTLDPFGPGSDFPFAAQCHPLHFDRG